MQILVVEDDAIIRESLVAFLQTAGFHVLAAEDGEVAIQLFESRVIHLVLLDIMLPKLDGFKVLERIRKSSDIPVIMLTAAGDEASQLKSFDLMVDGYVNKPFSLPVLQKRIEALLKRYYGSLETWSYKEAYVNFSSYEATYLGKAADVKPKELDILKLLVSHEHQVLSREQMLDHVWKDSEEVPYDRVVDVYIKNLRKKLGLDCIVTIKNVGYKLSVK